MKTLFTFCLSFVIIGLVTAQNIGDTFSYTHASHTINYEITSLSPNQVKAIGAPSMITGALEIPPQVNNAGNNYAVVKINESAFYGDNNTLHAITSISFPEGLTSIEGAAFQGNSISSVQFPSTITEISDNSFSDNQLTTVTIPALVTYLGDESFSGNAIAAVQSESLSPATLYSGTFDNRSTVALTIPYGTMADYTAAQWTGFLSITEDISINPFNGVAINTDTSGAALHIKGFTDLAGQPNLKLSNASGDDLLTIYDDGTVSGTASEQWTELPDGGQDGQILQTDGNGNYAWVDTTGANLSQLEQITEGGNTGWRLLGSDPDNYGDIGEDALDLSLSSSSSSTFGATGDYSVAMGHNTTAAGSYSTAMGYNTKAANQYTIAMGYNTTATSSYSTAFGYSTRALGLYSSAMGFNTEASGSSSTALGHHTRTIGPYATALGHYTIANGAASTALGYYTSAHGAYSTALGGNTRAEGIYSAAMGHRTYAKSFAETVIGTYNINFPPNSTTSFNSNDRAFVVGIGSSTNNRNNGFTVYKDGTLELDLLSSPPSIPNYRLYVLNNKLYYNGEVLESSELRRVSDLGMIGWRLGSDPENYGNIGSNAVDLSISEIQNDSLGASGTNSFATGYRTKAQGNYSTATGAQSKSSGYASTAMGSFARASGRFSVALGKNTIAPSYGETVVGAYNFPYTPISEDSPHGNDRAFVVGVGTSNTNRRNGLVVYKNGTLRLIAHNVLPSITTDRLYVFNDKLHYNGEKLETSQLAQITEAGKTGWRLTNFNPNNYGNIGIGAVDLSYSSSASFNKGATGNHSIAMGYNNVAQGFASTAMGYGTEALQQSSTAMGQNTSAQGSFSTAMGFSTIASGSSSTAMGRNNNASGISSTSIGEDNTASNYASTAIGRNANATGKYSTAIGRNVTAKSFAEIGLGFYNTDYTPDNAEAFDSDDRILVVGYGSSSSKKDAMTILKNGKVGIKHNNFENNNAIAALQVNGSMRLANSGATCNANNVGTIRYRELSDNNGYFYGCRQYKFNDDLVAFEWVKLNN